MNYVVENELLMKEWNWNKNNELGLYPDKLTCGSNIKVWWKCKHGHEWKTRIAGKNKGSGCPYCTRQKALKGFNDLATTHPNIATEWNYEKNEELLPTMVLSGSDKKVWWKCLNGHEWRASIRGRTQGSNCPHCNKEMRSSSNETKIYYYINKYFPNSIWSYSNKALAGMELDIFIPEYMVAIEYDGWYWHQDIDRDFRKDKICHNIGIDLIRIRESQCPKYQSTCEFIYLSTTNQLEFKNTIEKILKKLGIKNPEINFDKDMKEIENLIFHKKRDKISFANVFPELAAEWHPTKNGSLSPEHVSAYSNKKVWWQCLVCKNEWMSLVCDRAYGRGCPNCVIEKQKKKVYCIELNKIFSSILDASNELNLYRTGIGRSCNGTRESAGKHPVTDEPLHWLYVEDQVKKDGTIINGAITLGYINEQQVGDYLNNRPTAQN